ncbi:MAG: primosomal protein N' [Myxococcota bacterium]|nr:primosomal protein N' [Myxococcota bacterium]
MSAPLFGPSGRLIVQLALPVPIDSLFTYGVPPEQVPACRPGCRVRVSFSGRRLHGVIVEGPQQDTESDSERGAGLREIEEVIDSEPVLSAEMITLLQAAALEALCPVGLAIAAAIPSGSTPRVVRIFELTPLGREAQKRGVVRGPSGSIIDQLARAATTPGELAKLQPGAGPLVDSLLTDGLIRRSDRVQGPSARMSRIRTARLAPDLDVESVCENTLGRAPRQAEMLRRLARLGPTPASSLAEGPSAAILRALRERNLVIIENELRPRNVLGPPVERDRPLDLTPDQARTLQPITEAIRGRDARTVLLHGVTGSGKTEVYLRAVASALEIGRQALILVPEISLTHQIVARLRARFGDGLAVLHSGLRPSERLEQWARLRTGETPIAVGARSALFAPLDRLGVIVIDEEHDSAYKNEDGFRYHARSLAERRSAQSSCPLILGSATPALETRHRADRGELERLVLPQRVGGRPLPSVEIVDMNAERQKKARGGHRSILSRPLAQAIERTLAEGGQAMLFLNRRGFSTQIFCFDCGHAERCTECDVALVYHAGAHQLRCHYCGLEKTPPERCGGCGNPDTALLGTGTERLEEEIRARFHSARTARMDRDTAARRGHVEGVLAALQAGEVDILIGTQMVAKGHDFPGVRLVGVIAADVGLHMPDFRAAERTFQLLTQVAGRAGRADALGRVVVQTFVPDHYAIQPVIQHDYERFYAEEIGYRQSLGYPPFGHISHVIVSSEQESTASQTAQGLADAARSGMEAESLQVLGPVAAPFPRLRGRYRYQLLLKGPKALPVMAASRRIVEAARRVPKGVQVAVDAAPVNML